MPGKEGGPSTPQGQGRSLWWGKRQLKVAEGAWVSPGSPASSPGPGSVGILTARGKPMIPILFHTLSSEPPPPLSTPQPPTPSRGLSQPIRILHLKAGGKIIPTPCSLWLMSPSSGLPPPKHFASKGPSKAMVFPVVMYGCDSWTMKKAEG